MPPLLLVCYFLIVIESALSARDCTDFVDLHRFDCYPDAGVTQEKCEDRGCCWRLPSSSNVSLAVPSCFYPKYFGYRVVNEKQTAIGFILDLEMQERGPFGDDIKHLKVDVRLETDDRAHIKVSCTHFLY